MVPKRSIITLVGVKQAKLGFAFIHHGTISDCNDCQYQRVCMGNLDVGRIYKVTACREKILACKVHEAGVRAVEVVESDILAFLQPKLAMEGVVITYNKQECDAQECPNFERCVPNGLLNGDRCLVIKVAEKVRCPRELSLVEVVLQRVPVS